MIRRKEFNYLRKPDVLIFETLSDRWKTEGSALEWKELGERGENSMYTRTSSGI